jgi:hypothetical protein
MSSFSLFLTDSASPNPIDELVAPQVPAGRFTRLAHLLAAEEVLDSLAAQSLRGDGYFDIEARARAYIKEHPELLNAAWLRNGGAVYDLIEAAREGRLIHQEPLDAHQKRVA